MWLEIDRKIAFIGKEVELGDISCDITWISSGTGIPVVKANEASLSVWGEVLAGSPLPDGRVSYTQEFERRATHERRSVSTGWVEVR